jgi:endonuclease/exonuclease/phosphatase family metal-dependent hydrolase
MTNTNNWNILDWNIRGINSQDRWNDIRQGIDETDCNMICLQETKRENFDQAYLRNFSPKTGTSLHIHHLLEILVELLQFGMETFSMVSSSAKTSIT